MNLSLGLIGPIGLIGAGWSATKNLGHRPNMSRRRAAAPADDRNPSRNRLHGPTGMLLRRRQIKVGVSGLLGSARVRLENNGIARRCGQDLGAKLQVIVKREI